VGIRYTRASRFPQLKPRTAGKSHNQTRIRSNGLRRLVQIPIRREPRFRGIESKSASGSPT
jgi:hypothetical protein